MLDRWWRRSRTGTGQAAACRWRLDGPLLQWSRQDAWTIANAVQGTLCMGETGSGKSSGSGRAISTAFLQAGFGGLVLCVKPDEAATWIDRTRQCGRGDDLILVRPGGPWRFNPFAVEAGRSGPGAGHVESLVGLFSSLLEMVQRSSGLGSGGRDSEGYWIRACLQLLRNFLTLQMLAADEVSVDALYRAIVSAPTSLEQACSQEWKRTSFCYRLLAAADQRAKTETQSRDFRLTADYILLEFAALSDKTRSVIVSTFTSLIDCLNRGVLHELFGTDTTFTPEASLEGKIIICDLPVKTHGVTGLLANSLLKHMWQSHIERRDVAANPRPVFLWMDEAQHFLGSNDALFLTTARSSRVATVLLTQSLPTLYAAFGAGEKGKAEADSLLANCTTKLFHLNICPVTNEWAASMVGRTRQFFYSGGSSTPEDAAGSMWGMRPEGSTNAGFSEQMEFELPPSTFTQLRNGGEHNRILVDGILMQSGKQFAGSGKMWRRVTFSQK